MLIKLNEQRQSDVLLDMFTDQSFQEQTFLPNFSTPVQSLKSNEQPSTCNSLFFNVENVSAQPLSCNEDKISATSFDQSQESASFNVDQCSFQPSLFPQGHMSELKSATQPPDPAPVPTRQESSLSLEIKPQQQDFIADNEQLIFQALTQRCFSSPITLNPTQVPTTQPSLVQQPGSSSMTAPSPAPLSQGVAHNLFMKEQSESATVLDSMS